MNIRLALGQVSGYRKIELMEAAGSAAYPVSIWN